MYRHLLVAIDGSDRSVEGVGNAVELARAVGARITFLDAETALAGLASAPVASGRRAGREVPAGGNSRRAGETLAKAEAAARAYGVPCDSRHGVHGKTADAIVEAARSSGCDLIFVASPPDPKLLAGPQTLSALMDARLPVLWSSPAVGPPAHAIAIIRDEHRSLAAVLHAWMHTLEAARRAGGTVDAVLMQAIVRYLQLFPVALHHPKEEKHLFRRLRERTSSMNAELDELERQHERDRRLVADLARRVDELASARAGGAAAARAALQLEDAVRRYTAFQWDHLGREEGVILPAAQRHLTAADWSDIDAAFEADQDLRFSTEADREVRQLFSRIIGAAELRHQADRAPEPGLHVR